jgi:hypothetical protein
VFCWHHWEHCRSGMRVYRSVRRSLKVSNDKRRWLSCGL